MAKTLAFTVLAVLPRKRFLATLAAFAVAAASVVVTADAKSAAGLEYSPPASLQDGAVTALVTPAGEKTDSSAPLATRRRLALAGWNGGSYTISTGETVRIFASVRYAFDPAVAQGWAGFFGWLYHGSELSRVSVYQAPLPDVQALCGNLDALGCYDPASESIVMPGDRHDGANMEEIGAHEYGHHVANNRQNDPWPAAESGTKRWASYVGICQRTSAGTAFPGDEGAHYLLNPGEGFAESYRMLNETRPSVSWNLAPQLPWLSDPSFKPDASALAYLQQDIQTPWTQPTVRTWTGRLTKKRHRLSQLIDTPLDGLLTVTLTRSPGASLLLADATVGTVVAPPSRRTITFTVCGQKDFRLTVVGQQAGAFSVSISEP
jgi:hypothetical protein